MELTDQVERKKKKKVCNTRFRLVLSMEILMEAGSVSFQRPVLKVSSAIAFTLFHNQSPFSSLLPYLFIYPFIFLVAKLDSRQQRARMKRC